MRRVIVLGGYGGFGARLSRRLAADGCRRIATAAGRAARNFDDPIADAQPGFFSQTAGDHTADFQALRTSAAANVG